MRLCKSKVDWNLILLISLNWLWCIIFAIVCSRLWWFYNTTYSGKELILHFVWISKVWTHKRTLFLLIVINQQYFALITFYVLYWKTVTWITLFIFISKLFFLTWKKIILIQIFLNIVMESWTFIKWWLFITWLISILRIWRLIR